MNAAALYLPKVPDHIRPDLVLVRESPDGEQITKSDSGILIAGSTSQQERFRQTIVEVVMVGSAIESKSHWGKDLEVGDKVVLASGSGEGYLIKIDGEDRVHKFVAPVYILAIDTKGA